MSNSNFALMQKNAEQAHKDRSYLDFLNEVTASDVAGLLKAEQSYGDSWKKRSGVGAFMMLARKWDRIEQQVAKSLETTKNSSQITRYDIFEHIAADTRPEGIIDDIRDLRRYLILVEAEMAAREVVQIGNSRDNHIDA